MWYVLVSHYIGPGVALQRGWRECENEEHVRDAIAEVLERGALMSMSTMTPLHISERLHNKAERVISKAITA